MTEEALDPQLLEQRLRQIRGIVSAQVVMDEGGGIGEIHVLATSQRLPKQLVRDIESLVLLHFKKRMDYRKISVVQLEDRRPTPVSRIRLKGVEREETAEGQRVQAIVDYGNRQYTGLWEGPSLVSEGQGAAQAALNAVGQVMEDSLPMKLLETKVTPLENRAVVIVSLSVGSPGQEEVLLGSSFVKGSVGEAAARAVLNALNRRLPYTPR